MLKQGKVKPRTHRPKHEIQATTGEKRQSRKDKAMSLLTILLAKRKKDMAWEPIKAV